MQLRDFGKRSGLMVAPVSIGAMRLPDDCGDAVELLRHAIDSGMRYIDTSRGYGESEFKLGRALRDGYREKVYLSTKCSPWVQKIQSGDDGSAQSVLRRIEESLLRLDVDYLDFYQVWNINSAEAWKTATRKGGMIDGIRKARDLGLIRHIGFTSHEVPTNLLNYLDEADWCEVLLLSYNVLNKTYAPVLEKAHDRGIGTIVMNPVGGGKLAQDSPILGKLVDDLGLVSLPDLAVRYVLSNPHVTTILCGISTVRDVDDTIAAAERGPLAPEQLEQVDSFFAALARNQVAYCTRCGYCQPCEQGVQIPQILDLVYEDRFLGFKEVSRKTFESWARQSTNIDACTKCGQCEAKCTQGLKIIKELEYALSAYGE